jgi:molybdopterin biosynthesis enzyme MoaB
MSEIVTAGILVIGDEILSGRTKDKNIGFIAEYLTNIGIDLKEVRIVADEGMGLYRGAGWTAARNAPAGRAGPLTGL